MPLRRQHCRDGQGAKFDTFGRLLRRCDQVELFLKRPFHREDGQAVRLIEMAERASKLRLDLFELEEDISGIGAVNAPSPTLAYGCHLHSFPSALAPEFSRPAKRVRLK